MKRNLLTKMIAIVALILSGTLSANALETYDFQDLCMVLGKGGPWAVNDGGDAGFTINDATMHYLGDYTEQGFSWNQRFAYEYVEGRGKFTMRNKNNKKDKNCGMFSWDYAHYFSVLGLGEGDKVTITIPTGSVTFVSDNVENVTAGDAVTSATTYTITSGDRLDIQMAAATLISKITIEPYGVETIPDISITPRIIRLIPGATAKLVANVNPSSVTTTWRTGDANVVTVDESGNITAVGAGVTYVYCEWKSEVSSAFVSGMCEVHVADVDLEQYPNTTTYFFTDMGDVTLELGDVAGAIWNEANSKNNDVFWCTNDGLKFLAVQAAVSGNKGWSIVDGQGLFLASGAGRCAAIGGVKKGQIVEFIYTGDGFYTKSDGSDDGISKTALNESTGRAIYRANESGMIGFEIVKGNAIQQITIYDQPFEEVDCTSMVGDAWLSDQGNVGGPVTLEGIAQKEQYNGSTTANCNGDVLYQVVEGLDNGTYRVELYANASYTSGRGFTSDIFDGELGRVIVYAGDVDKTIPVFDQTWVTTNNIVTLEDVVVTDGTLRMGLKKIAPGTNWHTIAIKSLVQTSNIDRPNDAAQDAYWKDIAEIVAADPIYVHVGGSERAAINAAKTKAAAEAAIPPFYAAKAGYDALAEVINKGNSIDFDMSEAEAMMTNAETTAEQAAAKAEELKHPINLAINTANATEGADMTYTIVNPSFETGDTRGWTYEASTDHGAKRNDNATYTTEGCDGEYLFNIWSRGNAISQTIEDLPNGTYKLQALIATDKGHQVQLNANDKSIKIDASDDETNAKGIGVEGELEFNVLDNKATIGAEGVDKYWYKVDNFRLTYVKGFDIAELVTAYETALSEAQAIEGDMNAEVQTALNTAIATEVDKTNADALMNATAALTTATAAAKASVAAYANAKEALEAMKRVMDGTNVYTAEAFETYNAIYTSNNESYQAGVLTTEEANALVNPETPIAWGSRGQAKYGAAPEFLLSAWETTFGDFSNYYINTWSTEGNNDGSNFIVPFFEYWTGDANSLGEKTLTATMNGLEKGVYNVTAWVRVRIKNGAEAPAAGISLQANNGDAVDVCTGQQYGQMYLNEYTATGEVAEDGVLNIKFIVAVDNNVSWLSFKNVMFELDDIATGISTIATESTAANGVYNLAGQRVAAPAKGLYIINGKKVVK